MKITKNFIITLSVTLLVLGTIVTIIILLNKKTKSKTKPGPGPKPDPGPKPPGPKPDPGPAPDPDGWIYRDKETQSDGVTHYWDCCKETCSWWNNAPDYGTNQCNKYGNNPMPPDTSTEFPPSVCDKGGTRATCNNRYPEIVNTYNSDGSKTLMGFVATAKELFPDFQPDPKNNYCGQCYEMEFYNETLNDNTDIKNAVVQVTNTGDGDGIFDFEVPGGGFGANNGCRNYGGPNNTWKIYKDQGGPCDPNDSNCKKDSDGQLSGCEVYGGFNNQRYCNEVFEKDEKAQRSCNDILFGVFRTRDQIPSQADYCPGFPDNIKIKRYRSVKCPDWHTSRTGSKNAPIAKFTKKINETCENDFECASRNCHNNKCEKGNMEDGSDCTYDKQCKNNFCNKELKCATRPTGNICYYNDECMKGTNRNLSLEKNKNYFLDNCKTPHDFCDKCDNIGEGKIYKEIEQNDSWNNIFSDDDSWINFFNRDGSNLTCPYLPNKYKPLCARYEKQCGGKGWKGPTYCGKDENEKTNCICVKDNDYYSQCRKKK